MRESHLLHELIAVSAARNGDAAALSAGASTLDYAALQALVSGCAAGMLELGLARGERVAIWLDKRIENVAASFGAAAAGGVFVPLNPLLKPAQVAHILSDCSARMLVTAPERLGLLCDVLAQCPQLRDVILTSAGQADDIGAAAHEQRITDWHAIVGAAPRAGHRVIDVDMAAILYTSGSTGRPKGVVLSHRNMVAGAKSVASYLENRADDTLLAALPLSFDAGFSQLTTAFHVGARVVLLNYLLPRDVLKALARERVTGLTAVPPLYLQLAQLEWPEQAGASLRYFANTGGHMPRETLTLLRRRVPKARPFLMYGLTEAFRSTYLPPEEVDRRPDSIGKAIPNAEILVLREDGSTCEVDEPGELVHRGALVGLGYWNDPEKTAERYRMLPPAAAAPDGHLPLPEIAVFSGDTVRRDADGFLYFIGRRDEMIKTSGYRVSPTEVEEVLYATRLVGECAAFGVEHARLGQAIQAVVTPPAGASDVDTAALLAECAARMPTYMVPGGIHAADGPLPRNPNGKIDRKALAAQWAAQMADDEAGRRAEPQDPAR